MRRRDLANSLDRVALRPAEYRDPTRSSLLARRFFDATGVWLEPRHTLQIAALQETEALPAQVTPVLWITCPEVKTWSEEPLNVAP